MLLLIFSLRIYAGDVGEGAIAGTVVEESSNHAIQYATVALESAKDKRVLRTIATDASGAFSFESVPLGQYVLAYSLVGGEAQETVPFALDGQHRVHKTGALTINTENGVKMAKIDVSSRKEAFYNSIDRKVYNVGKEIQSANGSASELMQNIPSVQVDIDGNVSLRGSSSVLILIDGRPSTLMGANRAAVLEQMPADTIDRIEVITNPSAKYKPDGTSGIINIVLKKKHDPGYASTVRMGVGNDRRYSASISGNYNPGKYNLYGTYSLRQDDRVRTATDDRTHLDQATNTVIGTKQTTIERARPLSHIGQVGIDYKASDDNKIGAVARYNYRGFTRYSTEHDQSFDSNGTLTKSYDRLRVDPEVERDAELKTTFQHSFAKEGEELNIELQGSDHKEQEDNHYTNVYLNPLLKDGFDNKRITQKEKSTELLAEYVYPMENDGKFETGYSREGSKLDGEHFGTLFDPLAGVFVLDPVATNRFIFNQTIHSLYGTFGRPWGKFGFLTGLRLEQSYIDTNQVTSNLVNSQNYFRVYPTLHLSYELSDVSQLQLNYSRRVRRPESDDLNPYPEYQDPFNLRAGNPKLMPEDIHSLEAGYHYKKEATSYLAGVYFRQLYHGMTQVTRYIDSATLLTTKENLAQNRSGGIELAATREIGKVSVNGSANIYYSQIDASNLGFSSRRSTVTWDAKLSANYQLSKATFFQFNSNFTAKRLTPQGYRFPTYVANFGIKHELKDKKTSLVLTVSDLFNSYKERSIIDIPGLHDETTRRRTSRIVYAGIVYNLGKVSKKKDDSLQYDSSSP